MSGLFCVIFDELLMSLSWPQQNVLNLLYAQLELDYNYIRAVTPFYSVYDISSKTADGLKKVMASTSPAAKAIRTYWVPKGGGYQVSTLDH